ncbi:hypothetical protein C6P45_003309 [Maudiozyma exigua]|uniref:Uncharacterized protein n=1 Tax=Maudiozyma exigua TaxID=34358 RepID=A0A9P7BBV9_MAUEX|nr:hypothetical protein C6P45_003309 [Kazachstania exigua]
MKTTVKDNSDSKEPISSVGDKTTVPITKMDQPSVKDAIMKSDKIPKKTTTVGYDNINSQPDDTQIKQQKNHKRRRNTATKKRRGVKKPENEQSGNQQKFSRFKQFSYMDGVLTGVLIGSIGATVLGFPH